MTRSQHALVFVCLLALCSSTTRAGTVYFDQLYGFAKTTAQYGVGARQEGPLPLLADIYQPVDIGNGPVPVNRPAIVIQDGGAWTSADRTNGRVVTPAIYLSQRGYTVIVTDYRQGATALGLINIGPDAPVIVGQTEFGTTPYNGITASGTVGLLGLPAFRAGIEDFAVALDWTRDNAASLGIDPNKVCAAGGSAGGIDALLLQYNNNPIDPRYRAQAVLGLVSTMMNNYDHIQPGGPPVFLLNNTADLVVPWSPEMSQRFVDVGIYREQWFQPTTAIDHNVRWDDIPNTVPSATPLTSGPNLLERVRDFLIASQLATPYVISELIGDANKDCEVGTADYAIWAAQFGQTGTGLSADFDNSGDVGAGDYTLWAANFGNTCAPSGQSVPEPSGLVLAVMALAGAIVTSVKRKRGR